MSSTKHNLFNLFVKQAAPGTTITQAANNGAAKPTAPAKTPAAQSAPAPTAQTGSLTLGGSDISFGSPSTPAQQNTSNSATLGNIDPFAANQGSSQITSSASPQQQQTTQQQPRQGASNALTMGGDDGLGQLNAQQANTQQPQGSITFKGGHTVKLQDPNVDWSRQSAGTASNNVQGNWMSDAQYAAFNDARNQLRSSGLSPEKATKYALNWVRDQQNIAAGGQANYDGKYYGNIQPKAAPAAATPTIPAAPQADPFGEPDLAAAAGASQNTAQANSAASPPASPAPTPSQQYKDPHAFQLAVNHARQKLNPVDYGYQEFDGHQGDYYDPRTNKWYKYVNGRGGMPAFEQQRTPVWRMNEVDPHNDTGWRR